MIRDWYLKLGKNGHTFGVIKLCRKEKNGAWFFNLFKLIFLSEMYGFEKIIYNSYIDQTQLLNQRNMVFSE